MCSSCVGTLQLFLITGLAGRCFAVHLTSLIAEKFHHPESLRLTDSSQTEEIEETGSPARLISALLLVKGKT